MRVSGVIDSAPAESTAPRDKPPGLLPSCSPPAPRASCPATSRG